MVKIYHGTPTKHSRVKRYTSPALPPFVISPPSVVYVVMVVGRRATRSRWRHEVVLAVNGSADDEYTIELQPNTFKSETLYLLCSLAPPAFPAQRRSCRCGFRQKVDLVALAP